MRYMMNALQSFGNVFRNPKLFVPLIFELIILLVLGEWLGAPGIESIYSLRGLSFIGVSLIVAVIFIFLDSWKLGMFSSIFYKKKISLTTDLARGAKIFPYYFIINVIFSTLIVFGILFTLVIFGSISKAIPPIPANSWLITLIFLLMAALVLLIVFVGLALTYHMRVLVMLKKGFRGPFVESLKHVFGRKKHFLKLVLISFVILAIASIPSMVYGFANPVAGESQVSVSSTNPVLYVVSIILYDIAWLWIMMMFMLSYRHNTALKVYNPGSIFSNDAGTGETGLSVARARPLKQRVKASKPAVGVKKAKKQKTKNHTLAKSAFKPKK